VHSNGTNGHHLFEPDDHQSLTFRPLPQAVGSKPRAKPDANDKETAPSIAELRQVLASKGDDQPVNKVSLVVDALNVDETTAKGLLWSPWYKAGKLQAKEKPSSFHSRLVLNMRRAMTAENLDKKHRWGPVPQRGACVSRLKDFIRNSPRPLIEDLAATDDPEPEEDQ
jgi:hypothetical protein